MRLPVFAAAALAAALWPQSLVAQGLRGDIHVGVDHLRADGDSATGATYGITLSYDMPAGPSFFGIQLDLDATDNSDCQRDLLVAGDRACLSAKRDTAIALRAGSRLGPGTIGYVTLGYANARINGRYELAGTSASEHLNLDGIRAGAAVAADISRRLFVKAEYRYSNYEDGISRHQALAGIGLHF